MKARRRTSQFPVQARAAYMSMCFTFFLIICCPPTLSGDILTCTNFCGRMWSKRSSHKYCFKALSQTCDLRLAICTFHHFSLISILPSHRPSLYEVASHAQISPSHCIHPNVYQERTFLRMAFEETLYMGDCKSTTVIRCFRKFEIFRVQWVLELDRVKGVAITYHQLWCL